jgi:hypothetical protein
MTLYEELLGERFSALSPKVQAMHSYKKQNVLKGKVNIKGGSTFFAKCMNFLMQLPKEQEEALLMLELRQNGKQETWKRTFGSSSFSSIQYKESDVMVEKIGLVKMYFRVFEKEKALCTVLEKSTFLYLDIPQRLRVIITSKAEEVNGEVHFFVEVRSFKKVLIIQYDGRIKI